MALDFDTDDLKSVLDVRLSVFLLSSSKPLNSLSLLHCYYLVRSPSFATHSVSFNAH